MQSKTKGLVLSYIKYRETSIIINIYTEISGITTYIEKGSRSAKGKNKMALFQPLTLLEMEVDHQANKGIQRIKEIRPYFPYKTIPFEIIKTSIGLFLGEFLLKVLKETEENAALFEFLETSLMAFDLVEENFQDFHLKFLWDLSFFIGIQPENQKDFTNELRQHNYGNIEDVWLNDLFNLVEAPYFQNPKISRRSRQEIIRALLFHYSVNLHHTIELKSWKVLSEVL